MSVYRRKPLDYRAPTRGLFALALMALVSMAFAADPAPLPKADPIQITPIAPAAVQVAPAAQAAAPAAASKSAPAPAAPAAKPGSMNVTVNGVQAVKVAQPTTTAADPNEAVRQAIRERMQGTGELVIRSVDAVPTTTAPAKPAAPAAAASAKPAAAAKPAVAPAVPWSYDGDRGPAMWGKLHPSYATCEKGRFQSPIDLRDGVGVDLPELTFEMKPSLFKVLDTGKTFEVHYMAGASMKVLGSFHRLAHIEFRHPAEERINGKSFGMSMQLHFRDTQGRHAVVSVLLSPVAGKENPFIQSVWNHIPLVRNEAVAPPDVMVNLGQALPRNLAYYTYMGSLTAPPCTEGVTWYVLKTPVEVSPEQIAIFARLYPNNTRPVQPTNNRLIKESRGLMVEAPAMGAAVSGGSVSAGGESAGGVAK